MNNQFSVIPEKILAQAAKATENLLPKKSKDMYDKEYNKFENWMTILQFETRPHLCPSCYTVLQSFYKFKKMCMDSNCQLKKYFNSTKTVSQEKQKTEGAKEELIHEDHSDDECLDCENEEESDFNFIEPEISIKEEELPTFKERSQREVMSNNTTDSSSDFPGTDVKYKCLYCKKQFDTKKYFLSHIEKHSNGTLQCKMCKKSFTRSDNLRKHLKIHFGKKEFECPVCQKMFLMKSQLKVHMVMHSGVFNFECSICRKKFLRKNALDVHMRIHTGERNYRCSMCEKTFYTNGSLKIHEKSHTGELDYECNVCNNRFSLRANLKRHIKKFHDNDNEQETQSTASPKHLQ